MVKFGERLPTLMVAAWTDKYIEYERLKAMLEDGALGRRARPFRTFGHGSRAAQGCRHRL